MRRQRRVWVSAVLVCTVVPLAGRSVQAQIHNPLNGHDYLAIPAKGGIAWNEARAAAESMTYQGRRGHLATITSAEELQFFLDNLPDLGDAMNENYWLGGYRARDGVSPADGWRWITGEPWEFTNWDVGEPNDLRGNEDYLQFWTDGGVLGRWNDTPISSIEPGFVVEFSARGVNCGSDWDGDGVVEPRDIAAFVQDWVRSMAEGHLVADVDHDLVITPADLTEYVNMWLDDINDGC
ncbi:MAG: hypothetical protein KF745_13405 [Phycisphaeraceae bacterium]|nr:hypothetical protein [Phycisphaeraceae bacterium]